MGFDFSPLDAELTALGDTPDDAHALALRYAGRVGALADVDTALAELGETLTQQAPRTEAVLGGHDDREFDATLPTAEAAEFEPDGGVSRPQSADALDDSVSTMQGDDASHESPEDASHESQRSTPHSLEFEAPSELQHEAPSELQHEAPSELQHEAPSHAHAAALPSEGDGSPTSAPLDAVPLTQSQEIVLPDPIPKEELSHESGELRLDGPAPGSGSFSLPEPSQTLEDTTTPATGVRPSTELAGLVDDVQDALEGSKPISFAAAARTSLPGQLDRDPDAEFDALLSDGTDPHGVATTESLIEADDLLRGLEGEPSHEAEELLAELDVDPTEVLDRNAALGAVLASNEGDLIDPDELDSGELEILVEDEALATKPPPPPPPPAPSAAPDKRPSLLGRLFSGKRDE